MRWSQQAALSVVIVTVLSQGIARAEKKGPWTGWMMTNDPLVQWRTRKIDWGSMSPDCDLQFRIDGEGAANFHWYVTYVPGGGGSDPTGHRDNPANGATRDKEINAYIIGCRQVSTARVDRVTRRGGAGGADARRPIRDGAQTPGGPPKGGGSSSSTVKPSPAVIVFPGPFRGPSLGQVRMDSRSLQWVRSDSSRLAQRLLDWRPVGEWARGNAPVIQQADWDVLGKLLYRVDKPTLRSLAAEASQHAAEYPDTSMLGRLWTAMAAFYEHQSTR